MPPFQWGADSGSRQMVPEDREVSSASQGNTGKQGQLVVTKAA